MTDDRRRLRRRGIVVPADLAAGVEMPEDLDAEVLAPHAIPDPRRRRRAAMVYVAAAALTALGIVSGSLPVGMWLTVAFLLAVAGWYLLGAWRLAVREGAALEAANRAIGFPVGHASANLGFRGWRSRPIWNVLVFSADDPPSRRGLVRVDAVDGSIVETYTEDVPEGQW